MPKRHSSKEIISALRALGFVRVSQKGSHLKFRKGNHTVIVPAERKVIPAGTFRSIVRQSGLESEDFG